MNLDQHQRVLFPIDKIDDKDRIRKDLGDISGLMESIKELGLIHPIVINVQGRLITGGRRLTAMRRLGWKEVPVTYFEFLDDAHLRILEREENVRRKSMTWQEETLAIVEVHERHSLNAALKSESWTMKATGELLNMSKTNVVYAVQLADYIRKGDKEVMDCMRAWDAIHLLIKRRTEESNKLVAKMTIPKVSVEDAKKQANEYLEGVSAGDDDGLFTTLETGEQAPGVQGLVDDGEMPGQATAAPKITIPLSQMLLHGDSVELLAQFPENSVDHVITDWPYAIDIDHLDQSNPHAGMKNVDMIAAEHGVDANIALHRAVTPLIFRVLKPGGFFITFIDYMQWNPTYDLATKAGFRVQRWPLVWYKTSRCINQTALINFTKNTEPAIVCRKDNANLNGPQPSSVWPGGNDAEVQMLGHPFCKPFGLWTWIYSAVARRGQVVLDPFAGRGSSTIAALQFGLSPIAIESNDAHHNGLVVNVSEWYKRTLQNVEFV